MAEEIITKKRNRKLTGHIRADLNKPIDFAGLERIAAAVVAANQQEDEQDMSTTEKGKPKKRTRQRIRVLEQLHEAGHDQATPQHAAAQGYSEEMMRADCDKADNSRFESQAVPQPGNPVNVPDYAAERESSYLAQGRQAASPGNRTNFDRPNGSAYAVGHPDLRQSSTRTVPFQNVGTNNDGFVGMAAFGGVFSSTDAPPGAPGNTVQVRRLDARGEAGSYTGMNHFDDRPANAQVPGHISRNSATPPNGSHSLANATSTPRQSMKSSDALSIMKAAMREQGIGR